jgi:predicted RNase H-like HicB family nuclease
VRRYVIVVERTGTGYSAYCPDLPGCIATGATREDIEREMRAAIEFHLDGMRVDGLDIPEPSTYVTYFDGVDRAA